MIPPVHEYLGSLRATAVEVRGDLVAVLTGDERSHLRRGLVPRTDGDLRQAFPNGGHQRVGHLADRDDHADRHTALPRRAVRRADRGVGRHVYVGIRQHDHVVLRPPERLHPLAVLRALLVDVTSDWR